MQEKRRSLRLSVDCPVSFVIEDVAGRGRIYNLSEDGCAVESDVPVPQEGYAAVSIMIPGALHPAEVELAGVRWVTRREFGLEFRMMSSAARKSIQDFLRLDQAA